MTPTETSSFSFVVIIIPLEWHEGTQSKIGSALICVRFMQSIIEAHGGKISVENNKDGGVTFTFSLSLD
jgi:K+-sensing histidine kinase KdpD